MLKKRYGLAAVLTVVLAALAIVLPAAADNGAPKWKTWTFNASGQAFSGGVPASAPGGIATFAFPATPDTSFLLTDHGSYKGTLLGNLTGKTLSASVSDSGGPFTYYGQFDPSINPCPGVATVRLYFQTKSSGSFAYTDYWWSHAGSSALGTGSHTLIAPLTNLADWTDWNGQSAADPTYTS